MSVDSMNTGPSATAISQNQYRLSRLAFHSRAAYHIPVTRPNDTTISPATMCHLNTPS